MAASAAAGRLPDGIEALDADMAGDAESTSFATAFDLAAAFFGGYADAVQALRDAVPADTTAGHHWMVEVEKLAVSTLESLQHDCRSFLGSAS